MSQRGGDLPNLWIAQVVRLIGILGLLVEIFVDHLKNPTALVVFGGLAEGPDLFGYWARMRMAPQRSVPVEREEKPESQPPSSPPTS